MKESAQLVRGQINLPLLDVPVTTAIPADKQKELTLALMELLISVALEHFPTQDKGGEHDEPPQAHT